MSCFGCSPLLTLSNLLIPLPPPPPLPVYTSSFSPLFFFVALHSPSSLSALCVSPPKRLSPRTIAAAVPLPAKMARSPVTFASERVSGRRGFSVCVSTDTISTHFREEQRYIFSQWGCCGGRALLALCVAPNWISNLLFILFFYIFFFCSFCKQSKYSGERSSCVK